MEATSITAACTMKRNKLLFQIYGREISTTHYYCKPANPRPNKNVHSVSFYFQLTLTLFLMSVGGYLLYKLPLRVLPEHVSAVTFIKSTLCARAPFPLTQILLVEPSAVCEKRLSSRY